MASSNTVPISTVVEMLHISRQAVHGHIRAGRLDGVRDKHGRWHVPLVSVERMIRERSLAGSGISVADAAKRLGVTERSVRRYISDGDLDAIMVGAEYRIAPESVTAFTRRPPGPRQEVSS